MQCALFALLSKEYAYFLTIKKTPARLGTEAYTEGNDKSEDIEDTARKEVSMVGILWISAVVYLNA